MHLVPFNFVFDVVGLNFNIGIELSYGLGLVYDSLCLILGFVCILLLELVLFLAFLAHC